MCHAADRATSNKRQCTGSEPEDLGCEPEDLRGMTVLVCDARDNEAQPLYLAQIGDAAPAQVLRAMHRNLENQKRSYVGLSGQGVDTLDGLVDPEDDDGTEEHDQAAWEWVQGLCTTERLVNLPLSGTVDFFFCLAHDE